MDLRKKPFYLKEEDIRWVEETLSGMTLPEKIGQLFATMGSSDNAEQLAPLVKQIRIGGIMYRPMPGKAVQAAHRYLQENSKIPLLTAANLEAGGNGVAAEGTYYGKPLQVAATDDFESGYRLGKIACSEGAAVGCNWSFAPIVDIDRNFRNPITNLRTFGSDVDRVIGMAKGYMKGADEENLAVSIKHFPGDGVDELDQHLLTSVNSLSVEEWDASYGRVYQELIDAGAKTVMVGHIAQPAYQKLLNPESQETPTIPASLSKALLKGLLREKLGFNGLIVSDATLMIGFTSAMKRELAVPTCIAAGCDMFLFNKNIEEDFRYMMAGYEKGLLSSERLDEAVTRILGLKASLGLHIKQKDGTLVPGEEALQIIGQETYTRWAKDCADRSVTLVKDTAGLLPLSPEKTKRVYLNVLEPDSSPQSPLRQTLIRRLEGEGFQVTVRNREASLNLANLMNGTATPEEMAVFGEMMEGVEAFSSRYDLVLYVANFETASNNTVVRIGWQPLMGMGNDFPWFVKEVPTLFVSLANPYHLLDVPMIQTFVNAYSNNGEVLDALMEKLMGRSAFKGSNPVDPFCGRMDTRQ